MEALSPLVDMIHGHHDSVWWSRLCLLRRVYFAAPHDEFSNSSNNSSSSVYDVHIPGTCDTYYLVYHITRYLEPFLSSLKTDKSKLYSVKNRNGVITWFFAR